MESDVQDEKPSASVLSRHRSPTFSREEVKALIKIVEKYKAIIFNKCTSSSANHAKEAAWLKIAKIFNRQGFEHVRSADCLKIKWVNLKKDAKKMTKCLMDTSHGEFDEVTGRVVAMMCEADNNTSIVEEPVDSDEDVSETENHNDISNNVSWNENANGEKHSDDSSIDGELEDKNRRSMNFTPEDCNLLLQCVRQEKSIVLSKSQTSNFNKLKNRAWERITNSYNKLSPQKRSSKVLRTKFTNMKNLAKHKSFKNYLKQFGNKHHKLEDSCKEIKSEPSFEYRSSLYLDNDDDIDNNIEPDQKSNSDDNTTLDPLSTVLNSDLGLSSISQIENKEVVKLKLELLNYKLETAKLKRKRLEDLMQADAAERESKARETALRLRAARLEAVAAEMKLPPSHPALTYTAEETRAQHYIHQYHTN